MSLSDQQWQYPPAWAQQSTLVRPSRKLHATFIGLAAMSLLLAVLHIAGRHGGDQSAMTLNASSSTTVSAAIESTAPTPSAIPRKIWQTWKEPVQSLSADLQPRAQTWISWNPEYRYELLTDAGAFVYVANTFADEPRVGRVFHATKDAILRADLLRYLVILADGGVYSDIDTDCLQPIDAWIPAALREQVGMVVGVEYDALGGDLWAHMLPVQLVQWTFMAKARHPTLRRVVEKVLDNLESQNGTTEGWGGVLETTGPRVWTEAIFESLSLETGLNISYPDVFNLTAPKLIGDVLIMNVNAFGSGQPHSNALPFSNDQALMRHYFHGLQNWVPEFEEKKKAAEERKNAVEEKRKAAEEEKAAKEHEEEEERKSQAQAKMITSEEDPHRT